MGAPGFWDDQEAAAKTSAEHARATRKLETFQALRTDVDDLEGPPAEVAEEDPEMAEELAEQVDSVEARLAALEEERLFSGRYDAGDALVTVNAGAGGTATRELGGDGPANGDALGREARLRHRAARGEPRGGGRHQVRDLPVSGENAYGLYSAEKGVHRLVRLSPFDSANRRQTSFAGVEVSPVVDATEDVEIEDDDIQVDTYRASGAGGQHVNKTDSAVRITHMPTGIVVQCQNERSQTQNKAVAMPMLRSQLIELEERKRQEEIAAERGEAQDVNFGSQIRSYVLHPYTMVKDHRTDFEMGDANRVLDGDLDGFVRAYLLQSAAGSQAGGR